MPITGTSKNYSGRKVDLSIFPDVSTSGIPVSAKLGNHPRSIAGPSKVAQNFLRLLLTPLGSVKSNTDLGSNFLSKLRAGYIAFPADLSQLFLSEAQRVVSFMRSLETDSTDDDERIGTVSLKTFAVNRDQLQLSIQMTTKASTNISFLLPVAWNV